MDLNADTFERIRGDIESTLRKAGWNLYWRWLGPPIREVPLASPVTSGSGDENQPTQDPSDPAPTPDIQMIDREIDRELENTLERAVDHLAPYERKVLKLMYEQALTARQAAKALGIMPRRAYYYLSQALVHLEAALRGDVSEPQADGAKAFRTLLKEYLRERESNKPNI
jgi:DNA-directed RNA polymerase specialized sigma24 family protein